MTAKAAYRNSAPQPITLDEPATPRADEAQRSVPDVKATPAPKSIDLNTPPIDVKTPEDAARVKSLVRQAADRGIAYGHGQGYERGYERGVRDGIEWAFREGVKVGLVQGSTASPTEVIEAFLSSSRAQHRISTVKTVERDDAGRITRVVETAK